MSDQDNNQQPVTGYYVATVPSNSNVYYGGVPPNQGPQTAVPIPQYYQPQQPQQPQYFVPQVRILFFIIDMTL